MTRENKRKVIFVTTYNGATGAKEKDRVQDADIEGMDWLQRHLYWATQNGKVVVVGAIEHMEPPA